MNDFTKINMKKIFSYYNIFGNIPIGWAFYPITYRNNKYVVELKLDFLECKPEDIEVWAHCYEYGEKKKILKGHKRKCVFEHEVTFVSLDGKTTIDLRKTSTDEIKIYLPKIMENIFLAYENSIESKKKVAQAEAWDGVVSIASSKQPVKESEYGQ